MAGIARLRAASLADDDGMEQLRSKIRKIQQSNLPFEERGEKLYYLLTESHRAATQENEGSSTARKGLPPREIIQPRLTELPVELVENIAMRLDVESLKEFRLTCKTLKVKIGHHFRQCYFTTRVVRPEWESFRKLMMILNHHDLGSAVRDIVIDAHADDHRSPGYRSLAAPIRSRGVPYFSRQVPRVSSTNNASSSQHLNALFSRAFEKIAVFRSLSFRAFKLTSTATDRKECSVNVLEETFKALAMSAKSISSLSLGTGYSHNYDAWFRLCDLHTEILTEDRTMARVLKNIDTIELGFGAGNSPTDDISDFPSKLLKMTPNLKNLELSIMPNTLHSSLDCLAIFTDIATSTSLAKLVQVHICSTMLTTQSVRTFLSSSKSTLRKVQITDVEMGENPKTLKLYLKQELTLDRAFLKKILRPNGAVWITDARLVDGAWIQEVEDDPKG